MKIFCFVFVLVFAVSSQASAQQQVRWSYVISCLQGGCNFVCTSAAAVKGEVIFQRRNVKDVEFLEKDGTGLATVNVLNERPTVIRVGDAVFCEMQNATIQPDIMLR
tara:strand:+ start:16694 stop:17014 length:321 start_codon:yes stop_codon:yes gene_type:complete